MLGEEVTAHVTRRNCANACRVSMTNLTAHLGCRVRRRPDSGQRNTSIGFNQVSKIVTRILRKLRRLPMLARQSSAVPLVR